MVYLSFDESRDAIRFLWITFCFTPSAEGLAKASISIMLIVSISVLTCFRQRTIEHEKFGTPDEQPVSYRN